MEPGEFMIFFFVCVCGLEYSFFGLIDRSMVLSDIRQRTLPLSCTPKPGILFSRIPLSCVLASDSLSITSGFEIFICHGLDNRL